MRGGGAEWVSASPYRPWSHSSSSSRGLCGHKWCRRFRSGHGFTAAAKDSGGIREFWVSLPHELSALRRGEFARYDDLRAGIRYEFDPRKNLLVRRPLSDDGQFESAARMFRAIFSGDPQVGFVSGERIIGRDRRSINLDGRNWLEYEWALSRYHDGKTATATMRVDPERKLPVFLQLTAAGESLRYDFDYPAEGPADTFTHWEFRAIAARRSASFARNFARRGASSMRAARTWMAILRSRTST